MIKYEKILNKNLINVFKEILLEIKKKGLSNNNQLYITFLSNHFSVSIPKWLKDKYPNEITIIIQYEFYDLKIDKDFFFITLSFNNIKTELKIGYESIISFADPTKNFGLKLKNNIIPKKHFKDEKSDKKNNILKFSDYKEN